MKAGLPSLRGKYNSLALISAGLLVLTILTVSFLIRPAWHSLKQLGTEIPVEEQARDAAKSEYEGLEKAKSFFAENNDDVETVNTAVPIEAQVPQILVILEELSRKNRVTLTSFVPQQQQGTQIVGGATSSVLGSANPGGTEAVEITANFKGTYNSMINFFFELEKSLRITDVKTVSFTGSGTSGGTTTGSNAELSGTISFKAYFKKAEGSK